MGTSSFGSASDTSGFFLVSLPRISEIGESVLRSLDNLHLSEKFLELVNFTMRNHAETPFIGEPAHAPRVFMTPIYLRIPWNTACMCSLRTGPPTARRCCGDERAPQIRDGKAVVEFQPRDRLFSVCVYSETEIPSWDPASQSWKFIRMTSNRPWGTQKPHSHILNARF